MKKLLCILALCLPLALSAQIERVPQLAGTYNASQTSADLTTWTLTGTFSDQSGTSDASNIQVGDYVFFTDGMYSFILPITEIVGSPTPPTITLKVAKGSITQISSVPTGIKGIYRSTIKGILPAIGGLPAGDGQSLSSWGAKIIDSLLTVGGGSGAATFKNIYIKEASVDLTDSVTASSRYVHVTVSSGSTAGNIVLPTLHDSLKNITITVQGWVNTGSTNVGVFTADGFITGYNDASDYHDYTTPLQQLANGEAIVLKPLFDTTLGTWLWSNTLIRVASLNADAATPNILYVAKYGSDSNPGTVYKPFLTIGAALTAATSGQLIYVREGTYSEFELPLKDNVNFFFESVTAGATDASTEGLFNSPLFLANTDDLDVKISGALTAYQLVEISKKRLKLDVDGYLIGQTFVGPGANHSSVNIRAKLTPSTVYQFAGSADTITRNYVSYVVDSWTSYATYALNQHYPIAFFNNTATRPKLNHYNISIGSVNMQQWGDFYSNRGIIQSRGVSAAWDSCSIRVDIGKGQFSALGVNVANFGLLAFWPYGAATGNQLDFNCDDCLFYGRSALFNGNFNMQGTDVQRITGKYRSFNRFDVLAPTGNFSGTNKVIFDGEFYSKDTTLFELANPSNFEFRGKLINAESDDAAIVANWANGSTRPTLRQVSIESPATTPITSTAATTWYVDRATEINTVTKDADITYTAVDAYDPAPSTTVTGTARVVPYFSSTGVINGTNTYYKLDTTTTAGAMARVLLNINNPTGLNADGDNYGVLRAASGDATTAMGMFSVNDQAASMAAVGYNPVLMLFRAGGTFAAKTNLSNGNNIGSLTWRGWANSGSRALSDISANYTGDGTTYRSNLYGRTSTAAGQTQNGWLLDDQSRFWLGPGADDYWMPITAPTVTNNYKSIPIWTGDGSATSSAWGTITSLVVDGQYTTGTPTLTAFGSGSYKHYSAYVELTVGASANTSIALPTASATTFGKTISITPRDLNDAYDIIVTGDIDLNGNLETGMKLTKHTIFECEVTTVGPITYRWVVVDDDSKVYAPTSATVQLTGDYGTVEIATGASTTTVNLPEIVTGTPGTNQVKVGFEYSLSIDRAVTVTINRGGAADLLQIDGDTTGRTSTTTTGGTFYCKRLKAVSADKWIVY